MKPEQNGPHFADNIFKWKKCLYFDSNFTEGPSDNKSALNRVLVCHQKNQEATI